ncbi:C1 family peptidase [Nisaea acidiphila]|uniref:C1 family peptidase n=1 Tax=Nisaea acidiphila TaxID=1862145 RepID=A0A9J7AUN7_9PROT|nr:C1 family peptidase [Nisaea acidiphila]UUX50830.1 C1 family peptidase [Nisaea acidiphila]
MTRISENIRTKRQNLVLNCVESRSTETDWGIQDALDAQNWEAHISGRPLQKDNGRPIPEECDLRADWWSVGNQEDSGACVGFATADGVLRWLYAHKGLINRDNFQERPSPRFIWMANKETDAFTRYPTTFLEREGTSTKLALGVAQKFGCVPESMLPMNGDLSRDNISVFFTVAAQFRISGYFNLGNNLTDWRSWIASNGPILTRLDVDDQWFGLFENNQVLADYVPGSAGQGHAVCLVGYDRDRFIIRNSWGPDWGDSGFAWATDTYVQAAFTEAYGALM